MSHDGLAGTLHTVLPDVSVFSSWFFAVASYYSARVIARRRSQPRTDDKAKASNGIIVF